MSSEKEINIPNSDLNSLNVEEQFPPEDKKLMSPKRKRKIKKHHIKQREKSNEKSEDYNNNNSSITSQNHLFESPSRTKAKISNEISKFSYLYSPRTTFSNEKLKERELFNDLAKSFDPVTIKIMKEVFKERLGSLHKNVFIEKIKNHLLTWHPELPNREHKLIQLLDELYCEIDLNNNSKVEWEEFTNYILNSSNHKMSDNFKYQLKQYSISRHKIDESEFTDMITYAFYIEKFNLIGLVQDGRSFILFYDGTTCKKAKAFIDVRETQRAIDENEIMRLDKKAKELVEKEEEDKRIKMMLHMENNKKRNSGYNPIKRKDILITEERRSIINVINTEHKRANDKKEKESDKDKKRNNSLSETPEKLKRELKKLRHENYMNIQKGGNKKLTILTTEFIDEYDTLLVSSSNNKISAWLYVNGEFKNANSTRDIRIDKTSFSCAIQSTDVPQYTMSWDPIQHFLYSGQADGKILKWQLTKSEHFENDVFDYVKAKVRYELEEKSSKYIKAIRQLKRKRTFTKLSEKIQSERNLTDNKIAKQLIEAKECSSRDTVSSIVILGKFQLLAAGYYNGNIILWDTMLKDYRKFYTDQYTGIYQLIYDKDRNLLFSCGFDHNIFIYDPYISGGAIYKLQGHNLSINSLGINSEENELVSIDILGNIKIWDLDTYYNYQTINLNEKITESKVEIDLQNLKKKKISSNMKMICLNKINKILTYGEKLMMFENDSGLNPELCDDQIILGCYYNYFSYEIVTICLRKIKMWNVFNGKVKAIYEDPMQGEITTFVLDNRLKRIYFGDANGKIKNFNVTNGSFIKDFAFHKGEITKLVYSDKYEMLISLSIDQKLKMHDDKELLETQVVKELDLSQMHVSTIAVHDQYSRLILGLSNGQVKFYNIETYRYDTESQNDEVKRFSNDEIVQIIPIDGIDIIFVSHNSGRAKFVIIPPNAFKGYTFGEWENTIRRDEINIPSCIVSSDYYNENYRLFTGDQFGIITCFDLSEIFNIINSSNEITIETIDLLNHVQIKEIFKVQAHKETIKAIDHPNFKPNIIITVGNDRLVKLFKANNGEFIDDLRQIASKYKDVPTGIEYNYADPFVSRVYEDEIPQKGMISRKELIKFHPMSQNKFKKLFRHVPISEYIKLATDYNAKNIFYLITKENELEEGKSNKWRLEIDLDYIREQEKKKFNDLLTELNYNENFSPKNNTNIIGRNLPISHENYHPFFIDEMAETEIKQFNSLLNQKLRHARLSIGKVELNKKKYDEFEEENKRKKNINLKESLKFLEPKSGILKKIKLAPLKTNRMSVSTQFGIDKKKIMNTNEQFFYFKEEVDRSIENLESVMESKLGRFNRLAGQRKKNEPKTKTVSNV